MPNSGGQDARPTIWRRRFCVARRFQPAVDTPLFVAPPQARDAEEDPDEAECPQGPANKHAEGR